MSYPTIIDRALDLLATVRIYREPAALLHTGSVMISYSATVVVSQSHY
jgi:hypothetical protein